MSTEPLDPQIAAILRDMQAKDAPRAFEGGVFAARDRFQAAMLEAPADPTLPDIDRTEEIAEGPVPLRLYVPKDPVPYTLVVWCHGGGYSLGNIDLFGPTAQRLSALSGLRVVAVGYRQAPEHPFPVPFDDALAATDWVLNNADRLGGRSDSVIVGGESSGGNLAASTAIRLRDRRVRLLGQLLVVPGVDLARELPIDATYPMLTARDLADIRDNLVPPGVPLATFPPSPLHAADLSGLAPAIIALAGHDALEAEGSAYADRLKASDVPVACLRFGAMHHQFLSYAGTSAGAARDFATICRTVKSLAVTRKLNSRESSE